MIARGIIASGKNGAASEMSIGQFERYARILYYTCVTPFKPIRVQGQQGTDELVLENYWLQKIFCLCLYFGGFVHIARKILAVQNTYNEPLEMFRAGLNFLEVIAIIYWVYQFCWNHDDLKALISCTSRHYTNIGIFMPKLYLVLLLVIPFTMTILETRRTLETSCSSEISSVCKLYDKSYWKDGLKNVEKGLELLGIIACGVSAHFVSHLGTSIDFFAFVLSSSLLKFTGKVNKEAKLILLHLHPKTSEESLRRLALLTRDLQEYFRALNKFAATIILCWFGMGVPWMSYRLFENFPVGGGKVGSPSGLAYFWISLGIYVTSMIFSAEAKCQVDKFKKMTSDKLLADPFSITPAAKDLLLFIEHSLQDAAFCGGPLFRISYPFLGSTFSAIVGYSFLALQFRGSPST